MDDASYRSWMTSLIGWTWPFKAKTDLPKWEPAMPGYANYYGNHRLTFGSARVNGIWLDEYATESRDRDPLMGARVVFNSKLVDLDPADTFTSQLVAARLALVSTGADGSVAEVIRGVPTTSYTRWLNIGRPYGAGSFQCVVPNDRLTISNIIESPALESLSAHARRGGGLILRYCLYAMRWSHTQAEMFDRYQRGEIVQNPKIGCVLGTIGVWDGRDMTSVPVGRLLHRPASPFKTISAGSGVRVRTHEDVERLWGPGAVTSSPDATKIGPAVAVVANGVISLDLLTTFPEVQADPDTHTKADFGYVTLQLAYRDSSNRRQTAVIGPIDYSREAYESAGGVIEIPLPADSEIARHLCSGKLRLVDSRNRTLLDEIGITQVETDDRCVYIELDIRNGAVTGTGSIRLRAFNNGEPITEPVKVRLEQWRNAIRPGTANSVNPLVVTGCEMVTVKVNEGDRDYFLPCDEIAIYPHGVELVITAREPGCFRVRFLPPGMPRTYVTGGSPTKFGSPKKFVPDFRVEFFANVRVLPWDDYSNVPDADLNWAFIYREVFQYYAILYPIMSTIIPWGPSNTPRDPERVAQFAALIRQAVDESQRGTALEMPLTRELSSGKRRLLQRWCDLQLKSS